MILQRNGKSNDDIALSPRSKQLAEDRYYRNLGMKEREEKFKMQRKLEKQEAEEGFGRLGITVEAFAIGSRTDRRIAELLEGPG